MANRKNTRIAKHLEYLEFEQEAKDEFKQMLKTKNIDLDKEQELEVALTRLLMATHLRLKIANK